MIRYSLGLIIVANLIEFLVLRILQPPHTQGVVTTFITQNPAIGLFLACIIAPIWEESFFRGFVLRRLFERFGYWWSSVLTAVIFALAHTEVISAVSIAYLLIVLGGASLFINHIFLRHRNLLLNIVVHSLLNFSSFVMLLVLK